MREVIEQPDPELSAALTELAVMVERFEGDDQREHFVDNYEPPGYPLIEGTVDSVNDARVKAEAAATSEDETLEIGVVGRVHSIRQHANYAFLDVRDDAGHSIQVILKREKQPMSDDPTEQLLSSTKRGDVVLATGIPALSRSGEPSILDTKQTRRLAAAYISPDKLGPAPAADERQARIDRFRTRSIMKRTIRQTLETDGFVEVVTPTLGTMTSGANAEVFTSRLDSLDQEVFLRISPELSLKTAIVQGYGERVYEIGTNFRNEGVDREHSPEFEMLEFYAAYITADKLRDYTAELIKKTVNASIQSPLVNIELADGSIHAVDLSVWRTASYAILIEEASGLLLDTLLNQPVGDQKAALLDFIESSQDKATATKYFSLGVASLIDKVFKATCRPHIIDPTFVERYPATMMPLARPNDGDPNYVDMFQGIVGSMKLIKGYQELNDPVLQLRNLRAQAAAKAAGDTEAMSIDWAYLKTLLQGLPPTAGCGIGIDRLAAVLSGTKNIHSTMPFPFRERFVTLAQVV